MAWENLRRGLLRISGGRELSALIDQALVSGSNSITNVILARALGLREFGVFALAWAAVLFVNSLQAAFIVSPMMSIGPKQDPEERPLYFGSVLVQEVVFALICSAAVFIAVHLSATHFPKWNVHGLGVPLAFATLAYTLQEFVRRYLFSTRQSNRALACDGVAYLTQLPILLYMSFRTHFSSQGALWVIAITSLAGFVVGCFWFQPLQFQLHAFRRIFARNWKFSRWLVPSALMQWSSGNLFQMAAPIYYGAAAAGVLRAAQTIVGVAHIWFLGLDNVVPTEAARRMHSGGPEATSQYLRQVILRWGSITLLFMGIVALFPSLWLRLFFTNKYSGYGHILQLYALFYLLVFFMGPLKAGLQAFEYTVPMFWSYLVMTIFSILFAGPFAKHMGLAGVMAGMILITLLGQGVTGIALLMRMRKLKRELSSTATIGV